MHFIYFLHFVYYNLYIVNFLCAAYNVLIMSFIVYYITSLSCVVGSRIPPGVGTLFEIIGGPVGYACLFSFSVASIDNRTPTFKVFWHHIAPQLPFPDKSHEYSKDCFFGTGQAVLKFEYKRSSHQSYLYMQPWIKGRKKHV